MGKIYVVTILFNFISILLAYKNIERANLLFYGLYNETLISKTRLMVSAFIPVYNVITSVKLLIFAVVDKKELERLIRSGKF